MSEAASKPFPKTYQQIEAAKAAAELLNIDYSPHIPTQKQGRFLLYFGLEGMFGGAAGGGKSDALLMGALQFVHVPNYAALILRRSYTDLTQPGALLDRAHDWFGMTDAYYKAIDHTWHFPAGSSISFGYLKSEGDKYRYQSAEFQYIGFDELTQFTESQYRYLFTRLRKPMDLGQKHGLARIPLRMRSATNPGGYGHQWVHSRFIANPSTKNRRFFPATLSDNPHVDRESYMNALRQLDPVTRAQMAQGDWNIRPAGNMFRRAWFDIVEEKDVPRTGKVVRYWDLAASDRSSADETAGALVRITDNGIIYIHNVVSFRATPAGVEERIRQQAAIDGRGVPVHIEQEPGASGKSIVSHYRRNVLPEYTVREEPRKRDKVAMASPWSARAEQGEVFLVQGPWITDFLDQAEAFPEVEHDDLVDCVSGAYDVLVTGKKKARLIV